MLKFLLLLIKTPEQNNRKCLFCERDLKVTLFIDIKLSCLLRTSCKGLNKHQVKDRCKRMYI